MSTHRHPVVRGLKGVSNLIALAAVSPAALACWIEDRWHPGCEGTFGFCTHVLALMPGLPGVYLRRAFYSLTLQGCSLNCWIDFGVLFAHRTAVVEEEVYVGAYTVVGSARLRRGCLIGTRANLLSGSAQHELQEDGRWTPFGAGRFQEIEIGPHAWIGEAAIIMADVGAGALVAAGSVVSAAVPPNVVVAGNPARFVRELRPGGASRLAPSAVEPSPDKAGYQNFIDWLKCFGILLIVFGHTAAWARLATLPPVYSKQLGVAFFLFATGFSLSRETRGRWHVAFNRLFEVYVFGIALAVILSAVTYVTHGRLQISNYAPFIAGVNVVFDFFPANPTTWYLGTYVHVILLWAIFAHRIRMSVPLLALSFVTEIAVRAWLRQSAGGYVAYMALPNWSTVFLLGWWYGQRRGRGFDSMSHGAALGAGVTLVTSVVVWSMTAERLPFDRGFPFMQLIGYRTMTGTLLTSALVSVVYVGATWLVFLAMTPVRAPRPVRFVARNTLVIFLAHMPIVFALQPTLAAWGVSRTATSAILMLVSVPGLAWLSEFAHRSGRPRTWRDQVFTRLQSLTRVPSGSPT